MVKPYARWPLKLSRAAPAARLRRSLRPAIPLDAIKAGIHARAMEQIGLPASTRDACCRANRAPWRDFIPAGNARPVARSNMSRSNDFSGLPGKLNDELLLELLPATCVAVVTALANTSERGHNTHRVSRRPACRDWHNDVIHDAMIPSVSSCDGAGTPVSPAAMSSTRSRAAVTPTFRAAMVPRFPSAPGAAATRPWLRPTGPMRSKPGSTTGDRLHA